MTSPEPRAPSSTLIAFDLDGVLYSSEPFLGEAYREAIANVNAARPGAFPRVPQTREILDHVGWPIPVIFANLFPAADPAALAALHAETLAVICDHIVRGDGILYPGVDETLRALHAVGHQLAIASNGRTRYIETFLSAYGLSDLFIPRVTADQVGDKISILRFYVYRLGLRPDAVIMVGDRASDVEAAQAVGCPFVGCDYGHGYRHEIEAAGPIVGRFDELSGLIARRLGPGT